MKWQRSILILLMMLSPFVLPAISLGQTVDQRNFIISMYQEYFQRNPSEANIREWASWFNRGSSVSDLHASFIGSEEYFNKHNRNTTSWLNGMFATVTNRNPTPQELQYWTLRLSQLRFDRRALAKEFLRLHDGQRPPNGWLPQQPNPPSSNITGKLLENSRLLRANVDREVYGYSGNLIRLQVNSLSTAAINFQTAYLNVSRDPARARSAYGALQSAMIGVDSGLRGFPGATNSRLYASNMSQLIRQIGRDMNWTSGSVRPPGANQPPSYYPPATGNNNLTKNEATRAYPIAARLGTDVRDLYYLVRSLAMVDYRYRGLATDIEWFSSKSDDLRGMIYFAAPRRPIRQSLNRLERRRASITRQIQSMAVDVRVSQSWYEATLQLDRLSTLLGPQSGGVRPPNGIAGLQALIADIDRASAECDNLIYAYTPYLLYGSSVSQLVQRLRTMKNSLAIMRGAANMGANRLQLQNDVTNLQLNLRSVTSSWQRVNQRIGALDTNQVVELTNTINSIAARVR